MTNKRESGILMHPTSLWGDFGIGDLGKSAYEFVDFLERAGQSLWQILPLTIPGGGNSPYTSPSAFAGNIYLISPELLEDEGLYEIRDIPAFPGDRVFYHEVKEFKENMLKEAYENFKVKEDKPDFEAFCKENDFWLDDFAVFSAVKDYYINQRKDEDSEDKEYMAGFWNTWERAIKNHMKKAVDQWKANLADEVRFHKFCQYIFFKQWTALKEYANKKGIRIIGDMPIFVSYDSADVWAKKSLFILDSDGKQRIGAGVPPDYFSEMGQYWGNPIYNWKYHKQTGYKWWINRINHTFRLVDILRIDHFRGFESYWEVSALTKDAREGKWVKGPGKDLFEKAAKALGKKPFIAKDLGIITEEVKALKETLGFPGMKVLQFAFGDNAENPYLPYNIERNSVIYTGTHDNDTSMGWYASADEKVKDHFRRYAGTDGSDPSWSLIKLASASVAEMAIFPVQDVMNLGTASRMNIPGLADGNWAFRVSSAEDLKPFEDGLRYVTELYGRLPEKIEEEAEEPEITEE